MKQSEFLAIICYLLKARENRAYKEPLVLALFLIGWKIGARLLIQSLNVAIGISY